MASVFTTTATWSGFIGAPGYTKFHWIDLATTASYTAATDGMRAFFQALVPNLLTGWTITVSQTVQEYDAASAQLIAEHSAATIPAPVAGTAALTAYAGGSGACVSWKCGSIYNGRRVQGRTFLVPLVGVFENNGTLNPSAITLIQTAGDNLINIALADFAVWAHTWLPPAVPGGRPVLAGGQGFSVQNCIVKDSASQLRSRRT